MTEQKEFKETELSVIVDDDDELEPQSLVFEDDETTTESAEPMSRQEEPIDLAEQVANEVAVSSEQVHTRFARTNRMPE